MELTQNYDQVWSVYIIEAENGFFYTGITKSLQDRFEAHKLKKSGAKFFRISKPKQIVYFEKNLSHTDALKKENAIKMLSRREKIALIEDFTKNG